MAIWLERHDQVYRHARFIQWHYQNGDMAPTPISKPRLRKIRHLKMTKHPTVRGVSIDTLISKCGATYFRDAMARFAAQWRNPQLSRAHIEQEACNISMPFAYVSTYHRIKFTHEDDTIIDSIHVQPSRKDKKGQTVPARFDTVLVRVNEAEMNQVQCTCILCDC